METKAGKLMELADDGARDAAVRKLYQEVRGFLDAPKNRALNKADRAILLTRKLPEQFPQLKEAAAYLTLRYFKKQVIADALASGDADVVLMKLKEIANHSAQIFSQLEPPPEGVARLVREFLPNPDELKKDENLFRREQEGTKEGRYEITRTARKLYASWDGVSISECVGGGDTTLDDTHPERWAIHAVDGARVMHVEKGGKYHGFIKMIPIEKDGKVYVSVDFGVPLMRNIVKSRDPASGGLIPTTFFGLWLQEASKRLPAAQKFVVGESDLVDNLGVLQRVRQHPSYALGTSAGRPGDFKIIDSLLKTISTTIPRRELAAANRIKEQIDITPYFFHYPS